MIGGTGFALLAVNAWLPEPSVAAIYVVGGVDGFFGALSVTALMAVTPTLVPRNKLAAAGALNMLTVRLGTMASPALGGVIIAAAGVGWNYAAAAAATLLTITLLTGLPPLKPDAAGPRSHPLRAAAEGAAFVYRQPVVRARCGAGDVGDHGLGHQDHAAGAWRCGPGCWRPGHGAAVCGGSLRGRCWRRCAAAGSAGPDGRGVPWRCSPLPPSWPWPPWA